MIATARRGCELMLGLGALLACETTRVPASVVVPASQSAAAGASAVTPAGGAAGELNGGIGGSAAKPAGSSGMGGNDTGSGGSAGNGASGGSSGASGRDADPSSGDELRYALWLGPTASSDAPPDPQLPGD